VLKRAIDVFRLENAADILAMRAEGREPCGPPPFSDIGLAVDTLWAMTRRDR
jgi:hypothetical protein